MEDALGPAAVVGQDEQALGVLVEAPDRVQPRTLGDERRRDEVEHGPRRRAGRCVVEVTPAGLWSSRYAVCAAAPMTRPSTAITRALRVDLLAELRHPCRRRSRGPWR